jgi:hypothetical protein
MERIASYAIIEAPSILGLFPGGVWSAFPRRRVGWPWRSTFGAGVLGGVCCWPYG